MNFVYNEVRIYMNQYFSPVPLEICWSGSGSMWLLVPIWA